MRWLVYLFAIFGGFAYAFAVQSSKNCVSWDDRIENTVFQPLRQKIQELSSEFKNFSGADFNWNGFGVTWPGGTGGNFSSFHLNKISGQNASSFCVLSGERILSATIRYEDLRVAFDNVELYTPLFSLGEYKPTIIFNGVNVYGYVNATTDATTKQCTASLGWLYLEGFDSLRLEMSGGVNSWIATKFFNWFAGPRIAEFLKSYTENQIISFQVRQFLTPAVQAQHELFCQVVQ